MHIGQTISTVLEQNKTLVHVILLFVTELDKKLLPLCLNSYKRIFFFFL